MMNKKRKQGLRLMLWGGGILVFCILFQLFFPNDSKKDSTLKIDEQIYVLETLFTEKQKIKGLSGRKSLDTEKGFLFVLDETEKSGIWMKDMNFPISIIWLDDRCKVTGYKKLATVESYPEVFYPELESKYIVEINPIKIDLEIGDSLGCNFKN